MSTENQRSEFLAKLKEPAKPVVTQVVPVKEGTGRPPGRPRKTDEPLDHFNLYVRKDVGRALRLHKLDTGESAQDTLERITIEFLKGKGLLK